MGRRPTACTWRSPASWTRSPIIVVSGINAGPNLGERRDLLGDRGGGDGGRFLGTPGHRGVARVPALPPLRYRGAGGEASRRASRRTPPLDPEVILNVNVPDVALDALGGFRATRLGHRHRAEPVARMVDPRGEPVYWVGPPERSRMRGPGPTSMRCAPVRIRHPLHVDLTRHRPWVPAGAGSRRSGCHDRRARRGRHDLDAHARAPRVPPARPGDRRREGARSDPHRAAPRLVDEALASRAYETSRCRSAWGRPSRSRSSWP